MDLKIPNDIALYVTMQEIASMEKLRKDLRDISDDDDFLDKYINDLKQMVTEYEATTK